MCLCLGNQNIHELTIDGYTYLRIELMDHDCVCKYAEYSHFYVESGSSKYRLYVDVYSGNAGIHNHRPTHAHTLSFSVFLSPFSLFLSPSVCLSIFLSLDFKKLKKMQAKQYKVYIKYLYISKSINCYMYAL